MEQVMNDKEYKRGLRQCLQIIIEGASDSRYRTVNWNGWYGALGEGPRVKIRRPRNPFQLEFELYNHNDGYRVCARITSDDFVIHEMNEVTFFSWKHLEDPHRCGDNLAEILDDHLVVFVHNLRGLSCLSNL
jgi:hypothetical protein